MAKKISIRLETSNLSLQHKSGVAVYTELLQKALSANTNTVLSTIQLGRLAARIYTKLDSYSLAPPIDSLKEQVDLTIFPNFAIYKTVNSKKTATVIHDLTYLYFPEATDTKNLAHLKRVVPRSIAKADIILTVSESVKKELVKEFSIPPSSVITTPIPPDPRYFESISTEHICEVKEKYGIKPNQKYIYFIGNLEPRKNLAALIKAYVKLPAYVKSQYSLILAGGKGWKTEATEQALQEAQSAGENIKHIGFIDTTDTAALYQGASLFVMPSLYEGFGIPILEAMASGCSVIAADIPVLREVGADGASYVDTSNSQAFADSIENALSHPTPKEKLAQLARRYTWTDNIDKILRAATQ